MDKNDVVWKFDLESYTMKDYLYFRYYIDRVSDIDSNNPDVVNEATYSRPVLYIKNIYKNDEMIEDWDEHVLSEKIRIINMLPSEVIVDTRVNGLHDPNSCLANFVATNFDEENVFEEIKKMKVTCPHCGEEYEGVFKFDDFFMF